MANKNDEVIQHGATTEYRPHEDDVSGGRDKSVQSEATGAEGSSDLNVAGSSSGGAAGTIPSSDYGKPRRDGGPSDDDEPQPAGNKGILTR